MLSGDDWAGSYGFYVGFAEEAHSALGSEVILLVEITVLKQTGSLLRDRVSCQCPPILLADDNQVVNCLVHRLQVLHVEEFYQEG